MWSGVIVCSAIVGLTLAYPEMGLKVLLFAVITGGITISVLPLAFPRVAGAFTQRWVEAGDMEKSEYGSGGIFFRAITEALKFRLLLADRPTIGYGLGSAGNAAWHFGTRDKLIPLDDQQQVYAAETDLGRNVLELGPVVGLCYIAFRITFAIWMGINALAATRRSGNPLPWLLFSFVAVLISFGQLTAHGTANGYGWLFAGFCMAATYHVQDRTRPVAERDVKRSRSHDEIRPLSGSYMRSWPGRF
jgi:hypothetical protein